VANSIPLSGLSDAAGGILLTPEQGELLTNGVLQEAGAIALAGDRRTISTRRETFPIWLGTPTAGFVGEAGTKAVTGAEFGSGTLNVKKIASIVLFTDEQLEDLSNGDVNVLVDTGVREAIADVADANAIGKDSGTNLTTNFDSALRSTTSTVELGTGQDALATAVSAAMGTLEANGYGRGNGILISPDVARHIRDARRVGVSGGGTASVTSTGLPEGLYGDIVDPLYGLERFYSTNLNTLTEAAGANKIVGFVAHRPNLHVRIRQDVRVDTSREATVHDGTGLRNLWQENLTGVLWETRLGFLIHDLNRSVVAITNGS
jgi:HK97 family phage major capsid protein